MGKSHVPARGMDCCSRLAADHAASRQQHAMAIHAKSGLCLASMSGTQVSQAKAYQFQRCMAYQVANSTDL